MLFQSALLEWSDDARENTQTSIEPLIEALATLWIAYAHYYASAKQFKSATEAFEQAVEDPIVKHVGRVWLEYARFFEDRNKLQSAQNVYIRALIKEASLLEEQDQAFLWNEFLQMMQQTQPELTLKELQQAVEKEHGNASTSNAVEDSEDRPNKRARADWNPSSSDVLHHQQQQPIEQEEAKTHVVVEDSVAMEAKLFSEVLMTLPPDIAASWMIRDGSGPAQRPQPALFQPSPPKLTDPTAKDILGPRLAKQLIEHVVGTFGSVLLNVVEGLWTLQALKEKQTKAAMNQLDEKMTKDYEELEASLDARLSVAGPSIEPMNQHERMAFESNCRQQRLNVVTGVAWEFRQLLCVQQVVLTKLQVPGFDGPTVDDAAMKLQAKICSYLHSAFFLRNRIGLGPHVAMLKKQVERLDKELENGGPEMLQGNYNPLQQHHMPLQGQQNNNTMMNMYQHSQQQPMQLPPMPPQIPNMPPPMYGYTNQQPQLPTNAMMHHPQQQQMMYGGVPPPPPPQHQYYQQQ